MRYQVMAYNSARPESTEIYSRHDNLSDAIESFKECNSRLVRILDTHRKELLDVDLKRPDGEHFIRWRDQFFGRYHLVSVNEYEAVNSARRSA